MELKTQSDTIEAIATALSAAQGEMPHAVKDSTNPFFKSKYADLASCIGAAQKTLTKHGLAVVQATMPIEGQLYVVTTLSHISGEWFRGYFPVAAKDNTPQAIGSGTTYARRFSFSGIINQTAEEDDAESAQPRAQAAQINQSPLPPTASSFHLSEKQLKFLDNLFVSAKWDAKKISTYLGTLGLKDVKQMNNMQVDHLVKVLKREAENVAGAH